MATLTQTNITTLTCDILYFCFYYFQICNCVQFNSNCHLKLIPVLCPFKIIPQEMKTNYDHLLFVNFTFDFKGIRDKWLMHCYDIKQCQLKSVTIYFSAIWKDFKMLKHYAKIELEFLLHNNSSLIYNVSIIFSYIFSLKILFSVYTNQALKPIYKSRNQEWTFFLQVGITQSCLCIVYQPLSGIII